MKHLNWHVYHSCILLWTEIYGWAEKVARNRIASKPAVLLALLYDGSRRNKWWGWCWKLG
jgi:hypothetical protein